VFAREHAAEFEIFDLPLQPVHIATQRIEGPNVLFHLDQFEEVGGVGEAAVQRLDGVDDQFERGALTAEFLRAFGLFPDAGFTQLEFDFLQPVFLVGIVKDTP